MHVVRTRSIDHTITCLKSIHRQVKARFERNTHTYNHHLLIDHRNYNTSTSSNATVDSIKLYQPFSQFQVLYEKKGAATNKQLFGHQLRQVNNNNDIIYLWLILYIVLSYILIYLYSIAIIYNNNIHLLQIQGVSVSVALALMDKFGTTSNFMQALLAMGEVQAEVILTVCNMLMLNNM